MKFFSKKPLIFYTLIFCFVLVTIAVTIIIIKKPSNIKQPLAQDNLPNIEKIIIKKGDIFALTLNDTKLSAKDSSDIIKELKKVVNINRCMPGDFYEILYDFKTGEWTDFCYYPSGASYYSITKSSDNVIKVEKKEFEIILSEFKEQGTITSSLWTAMSSQNISPGIILSFADIFAWQIDFLTDTKQGDAFKVIYEIKQISKNNAILSSKIIAAQYKTSSKTYNAFYFKTKNAGNGYFDENGKSVKSAFLKAPLQFRRISSSFTTSRIHPILKYARPHLGIDYAAPSGTPVSSIGDGMVTKAHYSGGFGNLVIIKHSNGYETYYGHLSKYAKGIRKGARVNQGQVIGYVGMTGLATGPHLDFRIKLNGKFFNFLTMKQPPTTKLTGENKKEFGEQTQNLLDF
ncbi:MAG: M23 family metallopeptidase [Endomicrobium sp.]|jgi:murein DD-endopeptidase MepM/ murein hydrolase activator NlpD|nr:M23 family metallopeptidase [Endomicrobium sp.]